MRAAAVSLLLLAPCLWAQSGIAPPQLGFVEDSALALRPAYGVTGNFILGPAMAANIESAAFSGSLGLLKSASSLAAFSAQGKLLASTDVAGGPALFAFSPTAGAALAYIPSNDSLIAWRGGAFVALASPRLSGDSVLAIGFPSASEATLIVQSRADELREVHLPLGAVGSASENALVGVRAPLIMLPAGDLVFADAQGIVLRRAGASDVHIPAALPARFSLQQMNQDWVELSDLAGPARFAIHTTAGRAGFYRLPESK